MVQADADAWARGEQAYQAGLAEQERPERARARFQEAADAFRVVWDGGSRSPELARDLAQSLLLAGDLPASIGFYRQALARWPHDRALQEGLTYARAQVAYPKNPELNNQARPEIPFSLRRLFAPDEWDLIAGLSFALGCLAIARALATNRQRWWWIGGFALVVAAGMTIAWQREANRENNDQTRQNPAVLQASTFLYRGNGVEYPPRFPEKLPAGVEIHVVGERGAWLQIRLAGGALGWVEKKNVLSIE
jgi:hypothetical protein